MSLIDNAAIHHSQAAIDAIHATGAMVIFLPPYSPDFMPLEELFAQVKNWIKENDAAWQFCRDPELMGAEFRLSPECWSPYNLYCRYAGTILSHTTGNLPRDAQFTIQNRKFNELTS